MPHTSEYLDLIVSYLNDPSNTEIKEKIALFRSASAENEAYFNEIDAIWKLSAAAGKLEQTDTTAATGKLENRLLKLNGVRRKTDSN